MLEDCDFEKVPLMPGWSPTMVVLQAACMALPPVVQESIADKFVALLKKKAMALKLVVLMILLQGLGLPVVNAKHKQSVRLILYVCG